MRLQIFFHDDVLRRYDRPGRHALFEVFWESGGLCYPSSEWLDFGAVILSWWAMAIYALLETQEEQSICFMDGPYELTLVPKGSRLVAMLNGDTEFWSGSIDSLLQCINDACAKVRAELPLYGKFEADIELLDATISKIEGLSM